MSVYGKSVTNYKNDPYIRAINEAFVGKSETLLEIEKAIGDLRANKKSMSFYADVNVSKEVLAINRLFEKQFGMKVFALKIYKSEVPNGYTCVFACNYDVASNMDVSKVVEATAAGGYRFKQPNDFAVEVNMSWALFNDPQYTNGEIVAIILHEVGHNFADCLYSTIRFANIDLVYKIREYYKAAIFYNILTLNLFSAYKNYKEYKEFLNNNLRTKHLSKEQNKRPNFIKSLIQGIKGKASDFSSYLNELMTRCLGQEYADAVDKYTSNEDNIKKNKDSVNKQNEVFADKFAGVYGYGPEQASSLYKMTMWRTKADLKLGDEDPGNVAINKAFLKIHKVDCHPQLVQRAREELKLLEREIKKDNVDPKLKGVIQAQIDELNKMIDMMCDEYSKITKDEKMKAAYNKLINDEDPNALSDTLENAIEEALDKLIEEDKAKNKK